MENRSHLPLAASRLLVTIGYALTLTVAILLLVISILLAFAWPQVMAEAIEKGMVVKVQDMQPWLSLVLLGGATLLALAARMLHRLSSILHSVSEGDPFTTDNSRRLRHIGWLMIFMQIVGWLTGLAGNQLPSAHNIGAGFDFSFSGLLGAFLAFVVAQLFEQARAMRDDLEGTV